MNIYMYQNESFVFLVVQACAFFNTYKELRGDCQVILIPMLIPLDGNWKTQTKNCPNFAQNAFKKFSIATDRSH